METLEDYLRRDAELYPDKTAVVCGEKSVTYRELWSRVEQRAAQMVETARVDTAAQMEDVRGRLVPFRAVCEIDTLVLYFAIHLAGGVAMPLEKDLSEEQYQAFCQLARKYGSGGSASYEGNLLESLPEGAADVLFTTGTTGKQKGVIISHATIIADAENLISAQGYHHDLTFIICGPLNHIGSLSKVYPMILVGGTIQLLDGIKDMDAWFRVMEEPRCQSSAKALSFSSAEALSLSSAQKPSFASFLVPASIRMLMAFSAERLSQNADRIEFIETGAAPMALSDMERLCRLLPHSRLYNTYASTETGIIATYDYNHGECLAGCLGKPMKHSQIVIVSDEDGACFSDEDGACFSDEDGACFSDEDGACFSDEVKVNGVGRVACKGKTLMSGYLGDAELTASVLRDDMVFTADLGRMDEQGRLRLEGRLGDVINVGGYKVAPTEVEAAALSLPMVKDCVCVAAQHRVLGTVLKLWVVLAEGYALDRKAIAKGLQAAKLENYKIPMLYGQVEEIKRTYNGKIDRKAYRPERAAAPSPGQRPG